METIETMSDEMTPTLKRQLMVAFLERETLYWRHRFAECAESNIQRRRQCAFKWRAATELLRAVTK